MTGAGIFVKSEKVKTEKKRIGVDESGKGDYFGYLVIAGAVVDENSEKKLMALGVKDSKKLIDSSVLRLSTMVKKLCTHDVVKISPEKYNALYKKFGRKGLNKLLAWGHARVIENLLKKEDVAVAISDKFGDDRYLNDALMERGKKAKVVQMIRGEQDMAVAAASILARAEFLRTLKRLSMEVGLRLPKGSTHIEGAINELREKYQQENLEKLLPMIAKMHFKTTKRVMEVKQK